MLTFKPSKFTFDLIKLKVQTYLAHQFQLPAIHHTSVELFLGQTIKPSDRHSIPFVIGTAILTFLVLLER